ncbi:MAG: response regulator [Campylobacterales bacterium]|nr:response regulator [Campylobacterales bacterium]
MISEYQNEMIALIVILLLLIIYLLVKINKQESQSLIEELPEVKDEFLEENKPQIQEPLEEVTEEETEQPLEVLEGSEEGDFGVEESPVPVVEETPQRRKSDIRKRDVVKHGKITKKSFEEFAGTKILVAEDNLINQKVISGLLADSGILLTMANDGQEALEILERDDDFLMILMDAHMPRVDGFEATRIIRENPKYNHIVVVALSGDTASDDIKKMVEAGMEEQLEKPLRMESLYEVLYAYSGGQKEKTENDIDYIEVPMTKELHGEKGLAICGGDEQFYIDILQEFVTTYENSAEELRSLLKSSEEKAADKLLLDIMGVSANIGAEHFTKAANNLKEALSDTKEQSYFTLLDQYQGHLERLVKDIKEYLTK